MTHEFDHVSVSQQLFHYTASTAGPRQALPTWTSVTETLHGSLCGLSTDQCCCYFVVVIVVVVADRAV